MLVFAGDQKSILGVEFMQLDEGQNAAPAVEAMPEVAGETAPAAAGKRQIKKWWIAAGAAVLACVVIACLLLLPRKSAPKIDTAFFTQETPNEAGKAFLTFSHRTWIENSGGTDYQMYDFTLTEKNGVAFSISRIETQGDAHSGAIKKQR